jgi:hypothetical protein
MTRRLLIPIVLICLSVFVTGSAFSAARETDCQNLF